MVSSPAIRAGGQPTAARMPTSRRRAATSSLKSSHSSSKPDATTKLESARNRLPNGVEPRAAARACIRNGTTRSPIGSGRIAAASDWRISSVPVAGRGRCHAVDRPNRLPASRRAVSSDTNAFGVVPCSFQ